METYLIVIGKTSTGYSAHCPDVLGCAAAGKTVEEVLANMKTALEFHFEGMAEDGDPIPKPRGVDSIPPIGFDELDDLSDFHAAILCLSPGRSRCDELRREALTLVYHGRERRGSFSRDLQYSARLDLLARCSGAITPCK